MAAEYSRKPDYKKLGLNRNEDIKRGNDENF